MADNMATQGTSFAVSITIEFSHVMFKDDSNAMHVQPSLPEGGIHREDGLPVGGKLRLRGVFGSAVLQGQDLREEEQTEQRLAERIENRGGGLAVRNMQ